MAVSLSPAMPRWLPLGWFKAAVWQPLACVLGTLRHPPAIPPVYRAFNHLRQMYVLVQAQKVFARRDDDPAVLFGKQLLDAGCGASTVAQLLALAGAEITAVDADEAAITKARTEAENFGAPVTFVNNYVESLLAEPLRYDVILAFDLLEETQDPQKMIWLLSQLLAPGGMLVFSAIDKTVKAWLVHIVLSAWLYRRVARGETTKRRWKYFTPPERLAQLAGANGLTAANTQRLCFSLNRQQWVPGTRRRCGTRYLMTFTAPAA